MAAGSSGQWRAGSGYGVWGGEKKRKRKRKKNQEKKMKEDGERVIMGVFGKWQCRGKDCGKERKNGRENGDRRV